MVPKVVVFCLVVGKGLAVPSANQQPGPAVVHLVALVAPVARLPKDLERPGPAASPLPHIPPASYPSTTLEKEDVWGEEDVWVEEAKHV